MAHLADRGEEHERFMRLALAEARKALESGEVPVGAVLALGDEVVAQGFNQPIQSVDPTAHAEIVVLRSAARRIGNYRLTGHTLYATLEPCLMCVGAIVQARVGTLVFGAREPKFGGVESRVELAALGLPHRVTVISGVLEEECRSLIQGFFKLKRDDL